MHPQAHIEAHHRASSSIIKPTQQKARKCEPRLRNTTLSTSKVDANKSIPKPIEYPHKKQEIKSPAYGIQHFRNRRLTPTSPTPSPYKAPIDNQKVCPSVSPIESPLHHHHHIITSSSSHLHTIITSSHHHIIMISKLETNKFIPKPI